MSNYIKFRDNLLNNTKVYDINTTFRAITKTNIDFEEIIHKKYHGFNYKRCFSLERVLSRQYTYT